MLQAYSFQSMISSTIFFGYTGTSLNIGTELFMLEKTEKKIFYTNITEKFCGVSIFEQISIDMFTLRTF